MDNCNCSEPRGVGIPFPYFASFTMAPPYLPDFYWNVYSNEERIKAICRRLCELETYLDELVTYINEMSEKVAAMESAAEA